MRAKLPRPSVWSVVELKAVKRWTLQNNSFSFVSLYGAGGQSTLETLERLKRAASNPPEALQGCIQFTRAAFDALHLIC
jgi:hypothetical protein